MYNCTSIIASLFKDGGLAFTLNQVHTELSTFARTVPQSGEWREMRTKEQHRLATIDSEQAKHASADGQWRQTPSLRREMNESRKHIAQVSRTIIYAFKLNFRFERKLIEQFRNGDRQKLCTKLTQNFEYDCEATSVCFIKLWNHCTISISLSEFRASKQKNNKIIAFYDQDETWGIVHQTKFTNMRASQKDTRHKGKLV